MPSAGIKIKASSPDEPKVAKPKRTEPCGGTGCVCEKVVETQLPIGDYKYCVCGHTVLVHAVEAS